MLRWIRSEISYTPPVTAWKISPVKNRIGLFSKRAVWNIFVWGVLIGTKSKQGYRSGTSGWRQRQKWKIIKIAADKSNGLISGSYPEGEGSIPSSVQQKMPTWWNSRHDRLKICFYIGRVTVQVRSWVFYIIR